MKTTRYPILILVGLFLCETASSQRISNQGTGRIAEDFYEAPGRLWVHIQDEQGKPTSARIYLTDAEGKAHIPPAPWPARRFVRPSPISMRMESSGWICRRGRSRWKP